jgi:hypothetical protein
MFGFADEMHYNIQHWQGAEHKLAARTLSST